jgi:sulfur relay (sulfurtransferase) DsrF/TusC family protein
MAELRLAVVLQSAPYGSLEAAEALRHALGAAVEGLQVKLLLVDAGVLLARRQGGQEGPYGSLSEALQGALEAGVVVLAEQASLSRWGLDSQDLLEGVQRIDGFELSQLLEEAEKVMVF